MVFYYNYYNIIIYVYIHILSYYDNLKKKPGAKFELTGAKDPLVSPSCVYA
jgi:hypothetical protein